MDRYISVSRVLQEQLGSEAFGGGFSKLMDRIHPIDRLGVFKLNTRGMQLVANHEEGEGLPKLHNLSFRALNQNGQWLNCIMKLDVAGYNRKGKVDKLFGVLWLNQKQHPEQRGSKSSHRCDRESQEGNGTDEHHCVSDSYHLSNAVTNRERDVVNLISKGKCTKEIAGILGISFHTVETHRKKLLSKFQAHNAVELIQILVSKRLWPIPENGYCKE